MHAYKFTHFTNSVSSKTSNPEEISFSEKIITIFTGVNNPRPINDQLPEGNFKTFHLNDEYRTSFWKINQTSSKGTVILFHGYGGCKSGLLQPSSEFLKMGYSTVLVDFMGSGDSEGNVTTIGFYESIQVKNIYRHLRKIGEKNIILYGSSMGAVSILRAISEFGLQPEKIILECPFSSLLTTVRARFKMMHLPSFPMAELIVFWGGRMNGFNGFEHIPTHYAKKVNCPVLLMHGSEDPKVSIHEIKEIYQNFPSSKKLVFFKETGHENYLIKNQKKWTLVVKNFLDKE